MDAAIKSLKAITESDDFEFVGDIAVFDAHEQFDGRKYIKDAKGQIVANPNHGKLIHKFDKSRLEEIVTVCNKRGAAGDLTPIGPGHLIPDANELAQPPVWGYTSGEYRVGEFGPQRKLGLLTGFFMKKRIEIPDGAGGTKVISGKQALAEFPRRSVELWHKESMIDWIALLRRTPERDLGLTAAPYSRAAFESWNSEISLDEHHSRYARACDDGVKLRYAMDDAAMGDQAGVDDPTKPPDSTITPTDQALSPMEESQADRFMCHYLKKHPWMQEACSTYSASPTNTNLPGQEQPKDDPKGDAPKGDSDDQESDKEPDMAKPEEDLQRFQKENDELKKKLADQDAKLAEAAARQAREERYTKYSKVIQTYKDGGTILDVQEEANEAADTCLSEEAFTKFTKRLDRYAKEEVAPVGGGFLPTRLPADAKELDEKDLEPVLRLMRSAKGLSFEEAVTQYRKAN